MCAVTPGLSLEARDLLTGRSFGIFDPEVSLHAEPDQILVSAVLTIDGLSTLLGPAPYAMTGEWRVEACEIRESDSDREWIPYDALDAYDGEVFTAYRVRVTSD